MLKKISSAIALIGMVGAGALAITVPNPGFESGALSPWFATSSKMVATTNAAHSGTRSANIVRNYTLGQTISGLKPSSAYTLSAWVKATSASNVIMSAQNFGGTTVSVSGQKSTTFHKISLSFTTGSYDSTMLVQFSHSNGDYEWLYVDDVELSGPPPPCYDSLKIIKKPGPYSSPGGVKQLTIHSTINWKITKAASWITLSTTSGSGYTTVDVTVSANGGAERSDYITVSPNDSLSTCLIPSVICQIYQEPDTSSNSSVGAMEYFDGSKWVSLAAGKPGEVLSISATSIPQWRKEARGSMVDFDGNVYQTVVIGKQEWTVSNIRTTHYSNGDSIGLITAGPTWASLTSGAYCFHNNTIDGSERQKNGALYNWYAVSDARGLAPAGWRVPTDADWTVLENYLIANGYNYDGTTSGNKIAKSLATGLWSSNTGAGVVGNSFKTNNSSGFSAFSCGYRQDGGAFTAGLTNANWWTTTEYPSNSNTALQRYLSYLASSVVRSEPNKKHGLSVRLVRDLK